MRALLLAASLSATALTACAAPPRVEPRASRGPLAPVPFHRVEIHDAFWTPWLERTRSATLTACLDKCDQTGRIANFARAGGLESGEHQGLLFNDSDVYKVLEGSAYALHVHPDPALEQRADRIIEQIAAAQEDDGYLNTYVQLVDPSLRWKNIRHSHELYCAGHLIEAGIAYWQATGKRTLLDVAIRFADRIDADFGPDKRLDPPGHEELELALLKLAKVVPAEDGARYVALARFFIEQRGSTQGRESFGEYAQDHLPVRQQREAVGHAVRAMYLYCGMADLAAATGDGSLLDPLKAVWEDIVQRKMYVTGGIGSSAGNEGFTQPVDLPNDSAYAETCAAIGMVLWNQRMYLATADARYAEIMERSLYNGALAGLGMSGELFFYDNPLGSKGDHHRVPWFDCSCCPSNLVRFLPALGERIYATRGDDELWIALYVDSETTVEMRGVPVRVRIETDYPWSGEVTVHVDPERPVEFSLRLRMPGWLGGQEAGVHTTWKNGSHRPDPDRPLGEFEAFRETYRAGDFVRLILPMEARRVRADERVEPDRGRVALMRGPLVYCAEGVDNVGVRSLALAPEAELRSTFDPQLLDGAVRLTGSGPLVISRAGERRLVEANTPVRAIPYALWDNRQAGAMVVWLPESAELAEVPGEGDGLEQHGVRILTSHCWRGDTPLALNDGKRPGSSSDQEPTRLTFWDHRGTSEWLEYRFAKSRELSSSRVYWFDDTGAGRCRVPAAWRLEAESAGGWRPVILLEGQAYGIERDAFQEVRFEPIETRALRMLVDLRPEHSAGVLEWEVAP